MARARFSGDRQGVIFDRGSILIYPRETGYGTSLARKGTKNGVDRA
jgi:stringent starvation protein B